MRTRGAKGLLLQELPSVSTPGTGEVALYSVDGSALLLRDDTGAVRTIRSSGVSNASVTTPAAGFATDTYLAGSSCAIPANSLRALTQYRCKFKITKTAAGIVAPIVTIRVGAAGTVADAARGALTFAAQTAVIDSGFLEVFSTFRTAGATAVLQSDGTLVHTLAATGLSTANCSIASATSASFDATTAAAFIGVSVNAGTSAAWTIDLVQSELFNLA